MTSRNAKTCRPLAAAVFAACVLMGAGGAHAGLFDDDEARRAILEIRQRIDANKAQTDKLSQDLQRANSENAQLRSSLLTLQGQIETLRADQATMRGQNEQLARDVADLQRGQKDIAKGVDERLRQFEPAKVTVDGMEFTASPSEQRDFDAALATFRKGNFTEAQTGFSEFMKRYPQSGYTPSALFWLGNAQYANRNYRDAITNFRSLLSQAPNHARAPEAALSIANCQTELKDAKAARKTLEDLLKAYPQSEAASAAKERLARLR
ncbi:tol-pal system protein YbgF [Xylophilus sp. ASV27]|uniref:tol-pal system protein YbgF n=1 Tax=Xylophilus sp. ASV27 TaxID=2795129 RepID=UPI0018EBE796